MRGNVICHVDCILFEMMARDVVIAVPCFEIRPDIKLNLGNKLAKIFYNFLSNKQRLLVGRRIKSENI